VHVPAAIDARRITMASKGVSSVMAVMPIQNATTVPIPGGKTPDLIPGRPDAAPPAPLDLPRLVMRRASVVAVAFLLLLLVLGAIAARSDTRDEISGALAFARMEQLLRGLPAGDAAALDALRRLPPLRHVTLRVTDAAGRVLSGASEPPPSGPMRWLMRLTLGGDAESSEQTVSSSIPRDHGGDWTATFVASPESEQHEALSNLLGLFVLLAASSLVMLAVMQWNVQRAFRPLREMLAAIARIEHHDAAGVQALPAMPIRELEVVAGALKRLAASLERAETGRRTLSQKILGLQEDERQRLARELHDEFGQRLTALRVDVAWLQRTQGASAEAGSVLSGMNEQIARIQADVRNTLARLQPFAANADTPDSAGRLAALLATLAASWSRPGAGGMRCDARVTRCGTSEQASLAGLMLPGAVLLALYRISQEAITNAARHAGGGRVLVTVDIDDSEPGTVTLRWSAGDDGHGLDEPERALQRGSGLAGIRERVWALDGSFEWTPRNPPPMRGLRLGARLCWPSVGKDPS
jgi:two-component system sensor histidine kinase UhpB